QYLGASDSKIDTFTITSLDGTQKQISFTIHGANDAATITGTATGAVVEAGGVSNGTAGTPSASGTLTVHDIDNSQAVFKAVASSALVGSYGNFTFDSSTGAWNYTLDQSKANGLNDADVAHDTLTVTSLDGTATQVIDVTIQGSNDAAVITGTSVA